MTRYMLSVFGPRERDVTNGYGSVEDFRQSFADTGEFNAKLEREGKFVFADGLAEAGTATTVDGQGDAPVITDGPYLEAKEYLGGFWVIDAIDLDEALALAAEGSKACRGVVEVRPFQTEADLRSLLEP
ncbi:YciI family protein [Microbacterium gorillae]|uniref:YciI family protein n=1 Tax=Microbacterium gorillae TaxID=1231063 RepID=UPI00058B6798|nr:YciI family protein [Microbacterium gorillae]